MNFYLIRVNFAFFIQVMQVLKAGSHIRLCEHCDWKCIQNDLDARCNVRVCWNRNDFYSSLCDARPYNFVCSSGRNATQANNATLARAYIVNWPLSSSVSTTDIPH